MNIVKNLKFIIPILFIIIYIFILKFYFITEAKYYCNKTYISNKLFDNIFKKFNLWIKENNIKLKKNNLVYWNFKKKCPININNKLTISNINSKYFNYLENKKSSSLLLLKNNFNKYCPKTYFSLEEFKKNINYNKIYFLKKDNGSNGKEVICKNGYDLSNDNKLYKNYIIQEGITNIKLIDNKKFIIRPHIVIYNKKIYFSKLATVIIHGEEYDEFKTDHSIQIGHNSNKIKKIPLSKTIYKHYIYKIKNMLYEIKIIFEKILQHSNYNKFIIIGPDIIINSNGELKILEFNLYPNLGLNKNENFLFSLLKLLLLDINDGNFIII